MCCGKNVSLSKLLRGSCNQFYFFLTGLYPSKLPPPQIIGRCPRLWVRNMSTTLLTNVASFCVFVLLFFCWEHVIFNWRLKNPLLSTGFAIYIHIYTCIYISPSEHHNKWISIILNTPKGLYTQIPPQKNIM